MGLLRAKDRTAFKQMPWLVDDNLRGPGETERHCDCVEHTCVSLLYPGWKVCQWSGVIYRADMAKCHPPHYIYTHTCHSGHPETILQRAMANKTFNLLNTLCALTILKSK